MAAMVAKGSASITRARSLEQTDVDDVALRMLLKPLQRHVVDIDQRDAVEVFQARTCSVTNCRKSGITLTSMHCAIRDLRSRPSIFTMLIERQRHVELIDVFPLAIDQPPYPRPRCCRAEASPRYPRSGRRIGVVIDEPGNLDTRTRRSAESGRRRVGRGRRVPAISTRRNPIPLRRSVVSITDSARTRSRDAYA